LITISEVFLTIYENKISKDILHTNSIKDIISEKNEILILGNSLTREGIDKNLFRKKINNKDKEKIKVGFIYPDDTSIIEWYYILSPFSEKIKFSQKNLVINFSFDQLQTPIINFEEIQRISSYLSFKELSLLIRKEKFNTSEIIDVYLSKIFKLYRYRERISKRVLDNIPNYRSTIRKLNYYMSPEVKNTESLSLYFHLEALVSLVDSLKINTTFCAMPQPQKYQIDESIISIINKSDYCNLMNMQNIKLYSYKDFKDGYHLNKNGSEKYTMQLIQLLKI
tara:strand:+ start:1312 stop:2154 length:843 start_codon:yes stop_codon:yes gene_type:complete